MKTKMNAWNLMIRALQLDTLHPQYFHDSLTLENQGESDISSSPTDHHIIIGTLIQYDQDSEASENQFTLFEKEKIPDIFDNNKDQILPFLDHPCYIENSMSILTEEIDDFYEN